MVKYEFYADVFVLTNMYLDFLAICSVAEILQQKKRIKRYLAGAALASMISCVLVITIKNYALYTWSMHFFVNIGMIIFCFFPAEKGVYVKAYGLMYLLLFVEGGCIEWLYNTQMQGRYYEFCVLFTGIPIGVFLYILRRKRKSVQMFYDVKIIDGENQISLRALYDTGNRLWDPYTNQPVQIISLGLYKRDWEKKDCRIRLIPFSTVAKKDGCLRAFTVEEVRVLEGQKEICIKPAVLAVAEQEIFGHGEYQMILHPYACKK